MPSAGTTEFQQELLAALRDRNPKVEVAWDEARGVARRVRDEPLGLVGETADGFLGEYGALFGPEDLLGSVYRFRDRGDELGWSRTEYVQELRGSEAWLPASLEGRIEVYGGRLAVHVDANGFLIEVQSSCWRDAELAGAPRLGERELHDVLNELARAAPGFATLQRQMADLDEMQFPLMERPRLVAYPWKGTFLPAWVVHAYGPTEPEDPDVGVELTLGLSVVSALSGERLVFGPTRKSVDNPTTGTGRAVTPFNNPATRTLNIIRVDATSTYRLKDTTHAREILTYDAAGASTLGTTAQIVNGIVNGGLALSTDADGDAAWGALPANTTDAERTAGQQPEVDAHHFCRDVYEWFHAIAGGRAGWDNDNFPDPPTPDQPVRAVTHVYDTGLGSVRSVNAFMDSGMQGGRWYAFLAFFDGNPTLTCSTVGDRAWEYLAGSPFVVAHEYQHAMTDFAMEDTNGNPGLVYFGWFGAVHEGLSDVFGGLYSEIWKPGPEFSPAGVVFRNVAYPRDAQCWANRTGTFPCGLGNRPKDHWADRSTNLSFAEFYDRGAILAHCAYLSGAGGVHQRSNRSPALIPVRSVGREVRGGRDMLKAARIWYRALNTYFSTHGNLTGIPTNDENAFRTLRDGCVSAAADIYGTGSREHRTTILAFYACGLHPWPTTYGADVTFLTWGADWTNSLAHVGLPSPTWASLDLFINNGGVSEWNALVNVLDATGMPTQFENTVYARVRNVGDQAATNVQVKFFYAKVGTAPVTWQPMTDAAGTVQTLTIGTLGAGQATFPDTSQATPPATASVQWWIPPHTAGETVDHYCIRAEVTSSNDVNTHNNDVQSNVAFAAYTPGTGFRFAFTAGNPTEEPMALRLTVAHTLPKGWQARLTERPRRKLKPGEEIGLELQIEAREGAVETVEAPYDGDIAGELTGTITGELRGTLTEAGGHPDALEGRVTGTLMHVGAVTGWFTGTLDVTTGSLDGRLEATLECESGGESHRCARLRAHLRPWRRVDVTQLAGNRPIGGITVQIQVPGPGVGDLPPTDTTVTAPESRQSTARREARSREDTPREKTPARLPLG